MALKVNTKLPVYSPKYGVGKIVKVRTGRNDKIINPHTGKPCNPRYPYEVKFKGTIKMNYSLIGESEHGSDILAFNFNPHG